ncbi:IclR family transcriptional regulator [Geopsychrobacter electrodiphilus]|uniref:IclR family transcriptional regulator n=1 Tax=Geopsychrobacter electrodiphilus TaxID=225196 RepID=UPI000360824A|nr:IclR family transcriptional regulator [Geopsychrobacter electrodiphilus]
MNSKDEKSGAEQAPQVITALARGLSVLRCFHQGDHFLGNQEIAARTGLPKATVSRLTQTLTTLGYLNHSKRFNQYSLGAAVLTLGYSMRGNMDILKSARPLMQELADNAEASVSLAAPDGLHMVYLENCVASANMIALRIEIGARTRIANTAMGRALLCGLAPEERISLVAQIKQATPKADWPKIKAGIDQGASDYQTKGFCFSLGDWRENVNSIAVPLIQADRSVLAINCGGPAWQLSAEKLEHEIGPKLVEIGRRLENL